MVSLVIVVSFLVMYLPHKANSSFSIVMAYEDIEWPKRESFNRDLQQIVADDVAGEIASAFIPGLGA